MQYAQCDENGHIVAVVVSTGVKPPICARQFAFEDDVNLNGKVIVLETGELVEAEIPIDTSENAKAILSADLDLEYDLVIADKNYFLANFAKIG